VIGDRSDSHAVVSRRQWLAASAGWVAGACAAPFAAARMPSEPKARIAVTLDLEMCRNYPKREIVEWDYEKGNLDEPTKRYAEQAARIVRDFGGVVHFFCVGRVLEQADVSWLARLADSGHPIGNHTYDHVNMLASEPAQTQFRFRRAPWLTEGRTTEQILRENVRMTTRALDQRAGIQANGFRTPGGFAQGLAGREDIQRMLLELGFTWVSSLYPPHPSGTPREAPGESVYQGIVDALRAAQPFRYPTGLIEVPMSPISDVTAFRAHYWKLDHFLTAIRRAVHWTIEQRAVFDFLAHPSCLLVEDAEFRTIRAVCELVRDAGDAAELVGLDSIAARV